jgi:ribonuclease Z
MDLSLAFLGTGGSVPTARRATACLLVRRGGDRILFDCGEGAQRQMQCSTGLVQLDEIYITHYHADHYLGLPGLLKTYDLQDREAPLKIHGPPGLGELFKALRRIMGRVAYDIQLIELQPAESVLHDGYEITPFPVEHRMAAYGYALIEEDRPGRFDMERARELGVPEGPAWGALQRGESVEGEAGTVTPSDVLGAPRPSRRVVITGDTAPCPGTAAMAANAELLVHDASFADEETARAAETGHSTARQAAELAAEAKTKLLALVHISSRYHVGAVLEEAREAFEPTTAPRDFDLIDIPFPEKAPPQLIKKGALQNDQQPTSANEPTAEGPPAPEPKTGSAAEASQAREPKTGSAAGTD